MQCDQRKPACVRCEKAKTICPGFRDLADVIFRDESQRVIQKATRQISERPSEVNSKSHSLASSDISLLLYPPFTEIGAHFFFAKYTCVEAPFSECYVSWLTGLYHEQQHTQAVRAAIEAVGLAGIANVSYTPKVRSESRERYGQALAATKLLLNDSNESLTDSTLMAVILLALYEVFQLNAIHFRFILAYAYPVCELGKLWL
jgi:hypothetical protein